MLSKYLKAYKPFSGRYFSKLVEFYGSNPSYQNPDFEDAQVRLVLFQVRLLYYTKIFRYIWRQLRHRLSKRVKVFVASACRWMHRRALPMRMEHPEQQVRNPFTDPLDSKDTKE